MRIIFVSEKEREQALANGIFLAASAIIDHSCGRISHRQMEASVRHAHGILERANLRPLSYALFLIEASTSAFEAQKRMGLENLSSAN